MQRYLHLANSSKIRPDSLLVTDLNLLDRAKKLDKTIELLVVEGYDMRNYAVHTGLAGVANLDKSAFEIMCAQSLEAIGHCMLGELHILGKEFELYKVIPNYWTLVDELDRVQIYAFADKALQSLGEPSRFFLHKGEPGEAEKTRGQLEQL